MTQQVETLVKYSDEYRNQNVRPMTYDVLIFEPTHFVRMAGAAQILPRLGESMVKVNGVPMLEGDTEELGDFVFCGGGLWFHSRLTPKFKPRGLRFWRKREVFPIRVTISGVFYV